MDDDFAATLLACDKKKEAKNERQKSVGGKTKRRKVYNEKFGKAHAKQMNDIKTGKTYGAGVALKTAMKKAEKNLTAASRNPKGTPKELLRCPYHHPIYCTVLGHTSCASKECAANPKSKAERQAILLHIKKMEVEEELQKELREQGT